MFVIKIIGVLQHARQFCKAAAKLYFRNYNLCLYILTPFYIFVFSKRNLSRNFELAIAIKIYIYLFGFLYIHGVVIRFMNLGGSMIDARVVCVQKCVCIFISCSSMLRKIIVIVVSISRIRQRDD